MELDSKDIELLALITREIRDYNAALEKAKLKDGVKHILKISSYGNEYMQSQKPWALVKGTEQEK